MRPLLLIPPFVGQMDVKMKEMLKNLLIKPVFAQAANLGTIEPPSEPLAPELDPTGATSAGMLEMIISNVLGFLTIIAGLYFLLTFVIASINWLGAGGDTGNVAKARTMMINAVVGMVIVVGTYAIVGLIGSIIGLDLLRPAGMILRLAPGGGE